ncbi:hypothetical protein [Falsiroseomonas selenitidurans]|uniref:Uncharacterized protein n=1 Tax=Falsiroseomonas selenitidurans TaxID=2716335 RepID=A0ABX1EC42_9PROT|nr:hypothetical protein [Falsiroseomonas selenitidurans]NKC34380.1 hypothetical protein [Falsiroseomonas selenitidurans]
MTAFLWQVLSVMIFPPVLFLSLICALLSITGPLSPLPWGLLAAAGASGLLLLHDWLGTHSQYLPGSRVRWRLPFSFWEELPVWALAGAVSALLFFLAFRGLLWAWRRLPEPPAPPA